MNIYRPIKEVALGLCLACFVSPGLKAQTATTDSSPTTPAAAAKQKEVDILKGAIQTDQTPTPAPATPAAPAAPAAAPAAPAPLPSPSIVGPLAGAPPLVFDAGPLGKLSVNGIISGFGMIQGDHIPGDSEGVDALSNGQDSEDRRVATVLRAGGRLQSSVIGDPIRSNQHTDNQSIRAGADCLSKTGTNEDHLHPHRRAADADGC